MPNTDSPDKGLSRKNKSGSGGPRWKTQPWYSVLLDLLFSVPHLLPQRADLVISQAGRECIMATGVPHLAAWQLSGNNADQEDFHQ